MNVFTCFRSLLSFATTERGRRRSRIWAPVASDSAEIQSLEQRILLSGENGDGENPIGDGGMGGISCFADNAGGADFGGTGDGATGGGGTGGGVGDGCEVSIEALDKQMLEGPYTKSRLDEGILRLTRTGSTMMPLQVKVELTGKAIAHLDYRVADMQRDFLDLPPAGGDEVPNAILTIPAGEAVLDFKLIASADHQFETPEFILATVVPGPHGGYTPADADEADLMLTDATADIDMSFSAVNLGWLDDVQEDQWSSVLHRNTDFDAGQYACDMNFYTKTPAILASDENDVVRLRVQSHIKPEHDLADRVGGMQFSIQGDFSSVRIYRMQKGRNGAPVQWIQREGWKPFELAEGEVVEYRVEGLKAAIDKLTVHWESVAQPRAGDHFDSVNHICWDVDLDIDSNNNSGLKIPERSDWEEYLEDNRYGIGKLTYPTRLGQSVPPGAPGHQNGVGLVPLSYSTAPTPDGTMVMFAPTKQSGNSGTVRLWRRTANDPSELNMNAIENGGDVITPGRAYLPSQLGSSGVVWMESVMSMNRHSMKDGVKESAPVDQIEFGVFLAANQSRPAMFVSSDVVQYMVNEHDDTFFPNLQFDHRQRYWSAGVAHTGVVLRDALISEAVYDMKDLPQFGQQKLREGELRPIGIRSDLLPLLINGELRMNGLGVAVYRDYLSETGREYVLAFAGTEMEVADIMSDVVQGLGLSGDAWVRLSKIETQYRDAMLIAESLIQRLAAMQSSARATGHSLGGGLASAASVAAQPQPMPANTFNAAGLHEYTVTLRKDGILSPRVPITEGALQRYEHERKGFGCVNAFSTAYDPLTVIQENLAGLPVVGTIPSAIGRQIRLHSPFDREIEMGQREFKTTLASCPRQFIGEPWEAWSLRFGWWLKNVVCSGAVPLKMATHHKIYAVEWGLMVEQISVPVLLRKFDIFGDPDPGK
jgi:hypothetical protein